MLDELIKKKAVTIRPSARQLKWQQMEFYAFIHFGMNTFTDREWGDGNEEPEWFNPTDLDTQQWVESVQSAGMKGLILTCKHHDGFCLWPSQYSNHTVKQSPWKAGRGDVVRETADACKEAGIGFGIYLSPWDRHEATYGQGDLYNDYFVHQLTELLTQYGEVFCVWFDGACGEGKNGKVQAYDWDRYYEIVRKYQPNAVISVCGPDVRWCGNEAGICRTSEWSVVPKSLQDVEKVSENSQQEDSSDFAKSLKSWDPDLGSLERIKDAEELIWYPAEVNTSIRPGWFYHPAEDGQVKTVEALLAMYYASVGGNATFLLNIPPDTRGRIHETDCATLSHLGARIEATFKENLLTDAQVVVETVGETTEILITFEEEKWVDKLVCMENIQEGQRIERFSIAYNNENEWKELYKGTVVGYKKICVFSKVQTKALRVAILESRSAPIIAFIGAYGTGTAVNKVM